MFLFPESAGVTSSKKIESHRESSEWGAGRLVSEADGRNASMMMSHAAIA